ncbi:retinal-specific phospholipid-transporting ATPase ABCA4 isoform X1 [Colletes gigas]|uniref:retinal-specific phospholipid-transporting ATPase ABCA4 isoform X1 n=2 Tax=Colletes gigas TaxID=935657 RepID=UPI001C9A5D1F|nr:retinal-specific phospholipid-transporting ATPase ABCA4 isoform X1 [Colletes gigas]
MRVDQIGLLLWKNYIVRKRQPGILALVFVWPVVVFMILYTIRDNVDPKYYPTCQFPARSMPRNGLLPFVQSFICSLGNPCDPLTEYEEVPSYGNATLGPLVIELQPMLGNETILSAVKTMPNSIQLLKSMAQILTKPEIKALFDRGIRLGDLFNDHDAIKSLLKRQMPYAREGLIDELFESSIKLLYLIETFGSSNIDGVICSPESLKKYLILPREEDYVEISKILCGIDSGMIPGILENLSKHLDFSGLLEMVDRVMAKFRDYDFFKDLKRAVETILDLQIVEDHVPKYLKLREWLPKMIMVFKNVTFKEIDLTFVDKALTVLDTVFSSDRDWPIVRQAFLRLNKLLELVKGMIGNRETSASDDFFSIMDRLKSPMDHLFSNIGIDENLTQILDLSFAILQSEAKLAKTIIDRHKDEIQLPPEILDGLRNFFSKNILDSLSYAFAFAQSIVRMAHHAAIINDDLENRLYNVSMNHRATVEQLLKFDPNVYRTLLRSFSRLSFVEKFVNESRPEVYFCRNDTLDEIFEHFKDTNYDSKQISDVLCSDSGKKFISDAYNCLELTNFENITMDTFGATVSMAFSHPVAVEKANLTSIVRSVKGFVSYLTSPTLPGPDWSVFKVNDKWMRAFEETQSQGRLDVLGIHLSIVKKLVCCGFMFHVIKGDLMKVDLLGRLILQDLRTVDNDWVDQVREHKTELIEAFYLTATDRDKVLKILEYENFTRSYCTVPSPPALLNFPKRSNDTLLKALVCRLAGSVRSKLDYNLKGAKRPTGNDFDWTRFNAQTIDIYRYIDALMHQKDTYDSLANLEKLKRNFSASWTTDLAVEDAFQISVGLICKFFSVMESPLFSIQERNGWKNMHAIGWATSAVFYKVEKIVDQIQKNDHVARLPEILTDMPQTEIILSALLRNLSPLILDVADLITMKPVHLISVLDDYKSREEQWPCVQRESVGSAMELRNGTREIVREIERISCNPALFIREWKRQPLLINVTHIFQDDVRVQLPPFDWIHGYARFRRVVKKLDNLINDAKDVALAEEPNFWENLESLAPEVKSVFRERWSDVKNDVRNILFYVDLELDKTVAAFQSNLSASEIWDTKIVIKDRVLILSKFIAHVVYKSTKVATDILFDRSINNGTTYINWLSLLGFNGGTPVAIYYNRLPYVLATLATGLSDPDVDKRIVDSLDNKTAVTCSQLFEWWSDSLVGLTRNEYRSLKNFTCDLDPDNFNAYTDLYMSEKSVWRKPVDKYRSFLMTSIGDVYDLAKLIKNITQSNATIDVPFSRTYLQNLLRKLRGSLMDYDKTKSIYKQPYEWTNYRLVVEGVSEALIHVATALKNIKVQNDRVNVWDFVESGDARELLKILDAHPEETIALGASLITVDGTANAFLPYGDIRRTMCNFRFDSSYWSTPNRTRFINEICSFDPYQLLRTITSEEYYLVVSGRRSALTKSTPLSSSLARLADTALNLSSTAPRLTVRSKIFDSTTWRNLSNETLSLLRRTEQVWARRWQLIRIYQLMDATIDLLAGGDVWQKIRIIYENSKMKPILTLIEDMPNIAVSVADTFVRTDRLTDFVVKLALGKAHPCDVDKYLIVPSFVRKKVLLSSITNFCQKFVLTDRELTWIDVLHLDAKYEENIASRNTSSEYNDAYLEERLDHIRSTIIRVASDGFKEPKIPTWWTSFKEGTYKDFLSQYEKEDSRALAHSVVEKLSTIARDVLNSAANSEDCPWCSTFLFEVLDSQLKNHQLYLKLLCQLNRLHVSEIHGILMRDFRWNETVSMIQNYKSLNVKRTRDEFVTGVEKILHQVVDIIVNFQNETYSDRIQQCYHKFFGRPAFSRPGLYVSVVLAILDSLQSNVFILDTARNHRNIEALTVMAENYVPIWKLVRDVVRASDVDDIETFLPGAMINVNAVMNDRNGSLCRTKLECRNATVLYDRLSSKRMGKMFQYDPKATGYPSLVEIAERLSRSLDLDRIDRELKGWRMDSAWNLTWLKEILRHISVVIGESGDLLDVVSKIDFENVSDALGVPDIVDGVVNILKDKIVDKLFDGMKEVVEDVKPFIADKEVLDDLYRIIDALESMDIFKNLGLLNIKYVIRDMFDNWDVVSRYLVEKVGVSNDVASMLSQAKIDMISVFMKERNALSLKDTICSPTKLSEMLSFNGGRITAEEVSSAICQLEDSQTQNVTIALIKHLNFDYIFKTLMSANVKNIMANANLTEAEGKMVLDSLGVAAELIPFFRDRLASNMPAAEALQTNSKEETDQPVSTSRFLQDSSEMLCGQAMVTDNSDLYKIISKIEDNSKESDQAELDSLPSDFCRDTYKSMIAMGGGKIIWSYVKPLLRGQILYAPNTTAINKVMTLANGTFAEMENFGTLMDSFEKTLTSLVNLSEMSDSLKDLQEMMSSDVMKIAIKSFGDGNFESGSFTDMNLSEISWRLKKSKRLIGMIGMLNDLLGCVLLDRIRGFRSEDEMEAEARVLMETREFLAGVVFLEDSGRSRRSLEHELPQDVVYKIRMDIDYVQSTKRLKNQFWIPGPESSFIEHLRYLRGFVQLQDSVDRAIIKMKSHRDQDWQTLTQQMPYPCWKDVPFQTTLYESQGIQVCFFFALMMCVGAAVRHMVWERESQNAMVMSVMGLKPWRNTMAWFITTFVELVVIMLSIALVLLGGKILPKSDPSLVLIMMLDYSFSVVTFCYMISTVCSSASLAAITTVVMFLLTFMPYIIVIAMEAVIGLGYKLLICLSMSTSFCYGCLYAARKEVQGIGLTWGAMWEESSPGDSMSLGLVLLMIALDGCIYALIGYLIARYTNSGRGFHDLRSRSLWWANTCSLYGRPSYLAFVNNLYFTNDVLHPPTTYQDEQSDVSSLIVNEKQTGVRFEGVRKVYNTDQGEVVAVDDFNLKLCEGEVTSLLGRNGAGKTTIIKMLTGMLAPTTGEICLIGEEDCKPDIGVCPQDNVLISTLTPREHMIFYAKLKRPKDDADMQRNVNEMLTSLELGKQEHEPVYRLSGGTKRRLCVALAFLGSPKLVILDEPGAGVDPAARRRIWRLIDHHRIGRTVILSTHHLDEADMLSDTVVVMHKGKILCTGSPLSLKMMHGRGYRLLVTFPSERDGNSDSIERKKLETLKNVIEEAVSNAWTNEITGTEVAVTLPFQGKNGINNNIAQAAKALEDSRKILGYSHFSLECDSLERVFLDLCSRADSGSSVIRASQDSVASVGSVEHVGLSMPDDVDLIDVEPSLNPSPGKQAKALLKKRVWHFRKDWMTFFAGLFLPTVFVAVAMGFSLIRPPSGDEPALPLTPKLYDTHLTYFYSIDNGNDPFLQHVSFQLHDRFGDDYAGAWQTLPNDTGTCECLDGQQTCHGVSQAVEGLLQVLPGRPTLDWIVSTHQEYIEKRYGGWSLSHTKDEPLFVVWYNNKGHHALPSYLNALNEAILRASGVQGHLTTLNHPLRLSSDQLNRTTLLQHVADVGVALVLLIAFSLVAAQGSKELVRERLSEEKRILFLAGVHPVTYWTTALIWDLFVFVLSIFMAVIVFEIFGLPAYVARDNLPGICLLLFLFAWAAIPFSHLIEKAFDDSSLSNMVLFCLNTFIGVASLATILVLDILGKTKTAENVRNVLHNILLIFPQYALGDSLVQISRNDITAQLLEKFHMNTYQSPLSWDLLGLHYVLLAVVGSILFSINLIIECRVFPTWRRQRCPHEVVQEDDDVSKERMRVEGAMSDDVLQTVKLRKEYRSVYGTNVAVQNLSIGVQAGKCFGLLGTNGAGKSTTFRMLTTEIIPTAGRIILKGEQIGSGPLCNGEVGYCPQSDGLDGFLSPHQCLTIHGEVCGLSNVPKTVESMLKRLDLLKYAHKRVSSLSGGNKRKLCAALSVMAPVAVVLMDEPTSGMDPATKDLVAKTIRRMTKNQSCVILTSHSVAECESLCNRVGILAKAGLRCIGTPQHLKHKFGEGYVAFLRFRQPISSEALKKALTKYLPQATVSSRQATAARLLLPRSQDMPLSTSFNKVKLLAEELKATDYTLTQSSLDQVLVNFSEEMENEVDGSIYSQGSSNNISNAYCSRDTIHMETF